MDTIISIKELFCTVWKYCPITAKRNLLTVNKTVNGYSIIMVSAELEFQEMINKKKFLDKLRYTNFDNLLFKYTIEILYDGYSNLLPKKYITPKNHILYHYENIYYKLAKRGNLSMLKRILACVKNKSTIKLNTSKMSMGAAYGGHKFIIEWLLKKKLFNINAVPYIAKGNHFDLLKWIYENGIPIYGATNTCAMETDNVEMIKWTYGINTTRGSPMTYIAKTDAMELLEWFYKYHPKSLSGICHTAIRYGSIKVLKWGIEHDYNFPGLYVFDDDDYSPTIEMLEWLKNNGDIGPGHFGDYGENPDRLAENAASKGHLDVVKWLHNNNFGISDNVAKNAIMNNHLDVLYWYKEKNFPMTQTAIYAVQSGNIEILKWVLDNGAEMSAELCTEAAYSGYIDVLKWLRNNQCPWIDKLNNTSITVCEAAILMGHMSIFCWTKNQQCECDDKLIQAIHYMDKRIDRHSTKYLRKWIKKNTCKISWDIWIILGRYGN